MKPLLTSKLRCSLILAGGLMLSVTNIYSQGSESPSMNPEARPGSAPRTPLGGQAFAGERPPGAVTEITATETATFDNNSSVAEFIGSVVVKDPQFQMTCDRLKAFLNADRKGLDRVEAMGNVVIRQENQDDRGGQSVTIARAGRAVFVPSTGDIILEDSPQIQQGINRHVSTEPGTKMFINRDGRIRTDGGSKTMITDAEGGL
jgi:lipopolysaccharide export system protein LptA